MDRILITPELDICRSDLALKVDFSKPFVLRDLMRASVSSSTISVPEMAELVRCPFIDELWAEASGNEYEPFPLRQVEAIQLTYSVETFIIKSDIRFCDAYWEIGGIDKTGKERTSLEMSPSYRMTDLPVRINPQSEWYEFQGTQVRSKKMPFTPPLTLLDLMHAVYWHLGLFGSPGEREAMIDQFVEAIRNVYFSQQRRATPATVEAVKRSWKGSE